MNTNASTTQTQAVLDVIKQWNTCLDGGDLDGLLDCCDPEIVIANERQPTTVGIDSLRDKYAPRLELCTFHSGFDCEHVAIYGTFAIVIGHFDVKISHKTSGDVKTASGRLVLNLRKHHNGAWKLILDVDNNAA